MDNITGLTSVYTGIIILIVGLAYGQCPNMRAVIDQAEYCASFVAEPRNDTLMGLINEKLYDEICEMYTDSMKCIKELKSECSHSLHQLQQARAKELSLQAGFGQICEDRAFFSQYLEHSDCYFLVAEDTVNCWNQFQSGTAEAMQADPEYASEDYDPAAKVCTLFHDLEACDQDALEAPCGPDAADLFHKLRRSELPSVIDTSCNPEPTNNPKQNSSPARDMFSSSPVLASPPSGFLFSVGVILILVL